MCEGKRGREGIVQNELKQNDTSTKQILYYKPTKCVIANLSDSQCNLPRYELHLVDPSHTV